MRSYLSPDSSSFVKLSVMGRLVAAIAAFSVANEIGPVTHGWPEKPSKTTHPRTISHAGKPSRQIEVIENQPKMAS